MRDLALPINGVMDLPAYERTPEGFAPFESLRNIEVFPGDGRRAQIGRRRGHRLAFERRLGDGPVQGMVPATRNPTQVGYVLAKGEEIGGGDGKTAAAHSGNFWLIDDVPSLYREGLYQPGASTGPIVAAKWSSDGLNLAVAFNQIDADGVLRGYVRWCDADGRALWSVRLKGPATSENPYETYVNNLAISAEYVWATAGFGIHRLRRADGALTTFYPGWCSEVISIAIYDDGENEYLYAATNGSRVPGVLAGGTPIDSGEPAAMFRSGIQKFILDASGVPQRVAFGYGLTSASPWFEAAHGYLRMSEDPTRAPYGCNMNAMSVTDLGVYFCRTNQGWGPTTWGHRPLGTTLPHAVAGFATHDGEIVWLVDHDSLDYAGLGFGYYVDAGTPKYHFNDIAAPTCLMIAADREGDCYLGGRPNKAGFAVLKISGSDGRTLWRRLIVGTGGSVSENGLAVNPANQNLMVGGTRNASWGSGASAQSWELSKVDGSVVAGFDIEKAVDGLAIDCNASGRIVLGTPYAA